MEWVFYEFPFVYRKQAFYNKLFFFIFPCLGIGSKNSRMYPDELKQHIFEQKKTEVTKLRSLLLKS